MTDNDDYPAMNERQHVLLQSWPDDAGQDAQSTRYERQLSVDDLPKHDNGYRPRGVAHIDDAGFLPEPKPDAKHWYESKTIWFNLIITAMTLATSVTPNLKALMTPEVYGVLATGVAFLNAILRLVTGQPIKKGGV